jgi:hypothetical protein
MHLQVAAIVFECGASRSRISKRCGNLGATQKIATQLATACDLPGASAFRDCSLDRLRVPGSEYFKDDAR